jgi:pimeloyl-ACP methyl ester carboxylesterase
MVKPHPQGGVTLHYDPGVGVPFQQMQREAVTQGEAALWAAYDAIGASTLLLRGAQSDLLSAATAQAMTERGPRARLVEFAGVGHAPTLVQDDQVRAVCDFLLGGR